jgi:type IV pilus assembly protein PilM
VREALNKASFHGSEIGVVIPDEAARIAFLSADNLPKDPKEQLAFIRWKLRKTVPFDVDSAQIAFRVLGPHKGTAAKSGVDLGIVMSPRAVVQEYEKLMESLELHAGLVIPSTLAALNIYTPPAEDALFVKVAPDCVTTTVFQGGRMTFYRRVGEASLYDAVYPTILYYQDKLGGSEIRHLTVCGYPDGAGDGVGSLKPPLRELEEKLKVPARPLGTRNVEDIFKPALGTVQMTWQSSN